MIGGICASDNYIVFADVSLNHHLHYVLKQKMPYFCNENGLNK